MAWLLLLRKRKRRIYQFGVDETERSPSPAYIEMMHHIEDLASQLDNIYSEVAQWESDVA